MWYEGTISNAAGALKNLLDIKLIANQHWHIEDDSAGVNIGVYHNHDPINNVNYIVVCRDNQTDFALFELWESWDSINNVGTGNSLVTIPSSTHTFRINKPTGNYGLSVKNHRFIFYSLHEWAGHYIGQFKRANTTKNMPCMITYSSNSQSLNPLGYFHTTSNSPWVVLFDEANNIHVNVNPYGAGSTNFFIITIKNECWIMEHPVYNNNNRRVMGWLEGVFNLQTTGQGFVNGDIIYVNNVPWIILGRGGTFCLVEQV